MWLADDYSSMSGSHGMLNEMQCSAPRLSASVEQSMPTISQSGSTLRYVASATLSSFHVVAAVLRHQQRAVGVDHIGVGSPVAVAVVGHRDPHDFHVARAGLLLGERRGIVVEDVGVGRILLARATADDGQIRGTERAKHVGVVGWLSIQRLEMGPTLELKILAEDVADLRFVVAAARVLSGDGIGRDTQSVAVGQQVAPFDRQFRRENSYPKVPAKVVPNKSP